MLLLVLSVSLLEMKIPRSRPSAVNAFWVKQRRGYLAKTEIRRHIETRGRGLWREANVDMEVDEESKVSATMMG